MTVFKRLAGKCLAVALSLSILSLGTAWSAQKFVRPSADPGAPRPIAKPDLSLKGAPTRKGAAPVPSQVPAAAQAVARHPVLDIINALQAKGIALPETAKSPSDAAKLIAVARALPEGAARDNILAMAQTIASGGGSGRAQAAAWRRAFENSGQGKVSGGAVKAGRGEGRKSARLNGAGSRPADPRLYEVPAEGLRWRPEARKLPESTRPIKAGGQQVVGQADALKAVYFGLKMTGKNYNLFISGPEGSGRETALKQVLDKLAPTLPTPPDRVAPTNFDDKEHPVELELAPGAGPTFKTAVSDFIDAYKVALPQALASAEVASQKKALRAAFDKAVGDREKAFKAELGKISLGRNLGIAIMPEWNKQGELRLENYAAILDNGEYRTFKSNEEIAEKVKAGMFTQAEFDKAFGKVDEAANPFHDKAEEMIRLNEQDKARLDTELEALDRSVAAGVVSQLGAVVAGAVSRTYEDTPAHKSWEGSVQKRQADFEAEVARVRVGRFGVAFEFFDGQLLRTYNRREGGKTVRVASDNVPPADLAALRKAAEPFTAKFAAMLKKIEEEHKALHAADPPPAPREIKALEYVQSLLQHAALSYKRFLPPQGEDSDPSDPADGYRVSVLVSNAEGSGAPVVWEKFPSVENLFGTVESDARIKVVPGVGALRSPGPGGPIQKAGSYLRANGGFLVLNDMDLLREPGAFEAVMQAVRNGQVELVEDGPSGEKHKVPAQVESDSERLKVKVVLIGSPMVRMMLQEHDPDFAANFTASAEFADSLRINSRTLSGYLRFMKKMVQESAGEILDLNREAMGAVLEYAARAADSNRKLSAQFGRIDKLMREASFWAKEAASPEVRREHVEAALAAREKREGALQRDYMQHIKGGATVVETAGRRVGQLNGLSVILDFGAPSRRTIVATAGKPGVFSIDRKAETTGPTFNIGIDTAESFIRRTFAGQKELSAHISVRAEQVYGGIDGDSATSTEIYGILSALSGVPIHQRYAVTGSADQFGNVQVIGGVNEKIEGFFDLCKSRGLRGDQGVVIPAGNVSDLMLKPEVVEAVRRGRFHIYAVDHVSQGIEILTGVAYPEIVNKAQARLDELRAAAKE